MLTNELNTPESRHLLKVVDEMREILHYEKISLPHIVVVGDQSVGKSSVLEALSGVQLPRAQNICTRCPLELRLKNISSTETEYATIRCEGMSEIKINNLLEIMDKVTDCTVQLAGANMNVSSKPIYLTVYKKDIQADLTLIDLPGITRNPVGEQSKTIYEDIVDLIEHYIEPPTAIVLHVIPSSVDFTTSESIQLAKKTDPHCERQLIAVSKIDKYDKGIEEKLQGIGPGSMALKLGCVAILNRTQEEIDQNIPFDEMRRREKQFFRSHKAFEDVPEQYLGSEQLVKRLALIQQERIRSTLPSIIDKLKKELKSKKYELKQMPPPVTSEMDCWALYTDLIKKYREIINARVHGIYNNEMQLKIEEPTFNKPHLSQTTTHKQTSDDRYDERIAFQLYNRQKECREILHKSFKNFFTSEYQKVVLKLLEENAGVALPNFPSFSIIERLFRAEQSKFREPCEDLIQSFTEYLKLILIKILNQVFTEETSYKYQLTHKLTDIILCTIDKSEEKCSNDITKMLEIEERVFTLNHYYMDTVNKIKDKFQEYTNSVERNGKTRVSSTFAINDFAIDVSGLSNEHQAALDIQIAISAYCRVVEKRIVDHVSQLCYYWFITQCALVLDSKLNSAFTSANLFEWMREPFDQQQKRENLKKSINAMEKALFMGQNA
ncbi:unnamed protein product [Rotaria sordida]|uniref:Uncharacterized protein n=1 Tax=Rotaria sordida TaxID=392033 RepID=A0A819G3A0_9BILA|nr:unnamed protein product [Rotaria sordida]CAF3879491.1 unnamed protein product [Rotaria sordida]